VACGVLPRQAWRAKFGRMSFLQSPRDRAGLLILVLAVAIAVALSPFFSGLMGAAVLYVVRNSADAGNLAVGTCIDVPSEGDFSTVTKHECTEPHDAEVVLVAELTGDTFPITLTLENYIGDNCVPAVESYTGRAAETIDDLELGYFSPTSDAWKDGERTITCYLYDVNNAKLTRSVKAGAGAPASS